MKRILIVLVLIIQIVEVKAQSEDLSQVWPAVWIQPESGPVKEYSVCHFRKSFMLDTIPDQLIVHTSGDNRYQLYVNEHLVTWGPLTGDLRHWYYETTDIRPFLKKGKNVIAAAVMNYGSHPPDARLSVQTGFLLAAGDQKFRFLNTDKSWKSVHNSAYSPNRVDKTQVNGYYGGGSREIIDGNKYIWGWQSVNFDDSGWKNSIQIERAYAKKCIWASRWKLTPRILPLEEIRDERFESVRIAESVEVPNGFPSQKADMVFPPQTKARLVLDQGKETTAYPIVRLSNGKNATIKMTYCEAPYIGNPANKEKGNRDEVEGKTFFGYYDQFIADGGKDRIYRPFWWRAFRYLVFDIETKDEALTIHDISNQFSAYPFVQESDFTVSSDSGKVNSPLIKKIFNTGIHTTRLCSHETFVDCPYYEESQFEGDTRIEALVSYFNFGDSRLGRNAIDQFSWSVNDEGFLSARYPTNSLYYIPNFSIYWIGMLHDYMMYFGDQSFIRSKLMISRSILNYFIQRMDQDGSVRKPDYHNFIDWSFKSGEPPFDENGFSALVDFQFLQALQWAKELEKYAGEDYFVQQYNELADRTARIIRTKYWNEKTQLFSDTVYGDTYSQHTNCMAILTGVTSGKEARLVMQNVLKKEEMTAATLYWSFYVFEALRKAGLGDEYLNQLSVWKEVLDLGVTTWPETGPKSRSECHGWGASPNYHFFKIVAGIESLSPGFREIRIAPDFGPSDQIDATIPHCLGKIRLKAKKIDESHIQAEVEIPKGTTGVFEWNNRVTKMKEGKNKINL